MDIHQASSGATHENRAKNERKTKIIILTLHPERFAATFTSFSNNTKESRI